MEGRRGRGDRWMNRGRERRGEGRGNQFQLWTPANLQKLTEHNMFIHGQPGSPVACPHTRACTCVHAAHVAVPSHSP